MNTENQKTPVEEVGNTDVAMYQSLNDPPGTDPDDEADDSIDDFLAPYPRPASFFD